MQAFTYMFKDSKIWKIFCIYFILSTLPAIQQFGVNSVLLLLITIAYLVFYIILYGYMLKCIEAINIAKDNIILPEYNIIKDFIAGLKLAFAIGLYLLFIFLCLIILPRINPYFSILGIIFMLFMSFLVPAQIFAISGNKNIFQLFNYKYIFQIIKQQPINYIIKSIGLLLFNILISVITSKRFCYELSLIVQTILSPYIVLVSAYFIAKSVKTHNLEKD